MTPKIFLFISVFCITQIVSTAKAQINNGDSLALVDFYNSTNGPNWYSEVRHNWLTSKPVRTWNGVGVTGGRVTSLSLPEGNLIGTIPTSFGNLSALGGINLNSNTLSGDLPSSFFNLMNLTSINFESNQFTGDISLIGNLTKLTALNLNHNKFSGSLPATIGKLTSLQYLQLYDNQFTGTIPYSVGNLSSLLYFQIPKNHFTGILPLQLSNDRLLNTIIVDNNQLSGVIPLVLGALKNLTTLSLSFNQFTGEIPQSLSQLKKLTYFAAIGNELSFKTNPQPVHAGTNPNLEMYLYNNQMNFNGLEFIASVFPMAIYSPQAPVVIHNNGTILSVSAGGTLSNNTYTWFKVGTSTGTVVNGDSTFLPSTSGSYYATIQNSVATGLLLTTDTVSFTAPVANESLKSLSVYPNPVTNIIIVNGLNANSNYHITIADVNGNVWLNATVNKQTSVKYNVSSFKPRNYLLTVTSGTDKISIQFMKQ